MKHRRTGTNCISCSSHQCDAACERGGSSCDDEACACALRGLYEFLV